VPLYNLACLKAARGDRQGALTLLASMKGFRRPALLENDADLAAVRSLPGYPAVLQSLKAAVQEQRQAARRALRAQQPPAADPAATDPDLD
jgi:hypothetical protein